MEPEIITSNPTSRWSQAARVYLQPQVISMLFLGFASGLPFYLIYNTLSAWLRQDGIQRSTIGMLAWAGLIYTLQILWAPIVDRVPLPLLRRLLGRRRSWMFLAQVGVVGALLNLSLICGTAFDSTKLAFMSASSSLKSSDGAMWPRARPNWSSG